jgi:hypothetical protein
MAFSILFVVIALIVILGIGAFVYFVIWGMVVPGRVERRADDRKARRRTMP